MYADVIKPIAIYSKSGDAKQSQLLVLDVKSGSAAPPRSEVAETAFRLCVDSARNVFFIAGNSIKKLVPSGTVESYVGLESADAGSGYVDAANERARFDRPTAIATDKNDFVLIADAGNARIRRANLIGDVRTIAGSGESGHSDHPKQATAAQFSTALSDIAVSPLDGTIYVAESASHIRVISMRGDVSTLYFHDPNDAVLSGTTAAPAGAKSRFQTRRIAFWSANELILLGAYSDEPHASRLFKLHRM